jgi:superfamily II DNA/RNA helicase
MPETAARRRRAPNPRRDRRPTQPDQRSGQPATRAGQPDRPASQADPRPPRGDRPARQADPRAGQRGRRAGQPPRRGGAPARRGGAAERVAPVTELDLAIEAALAAPEPTTFTAMGLPEPLVRALAAAGIQTPFAIQARALPDALAGRDVLGRAQTGSGKTLAFGLPLLARLAGTDRSGGRAPRALVLVPTRELAVQVHDVLAPLGRALGLRLATVYGGVSIARQIEQLRRGTDVVIATPGRLIDLMERAACRLDAVEVAVLDEADHMADLGFLPPVTRILDATPAGGQRLLFSATLDGAVGRLVRAYLTDPAVHAIASTVAPIHADHKVLVLPRTDRVAVTAQIASRPGRTLIFVATKHGADRLARQLGQHNVEAAAIHGNLRQGQRQRALDGFSAGRPRVLVATDVAARGLHIDDVDLVIHFDLPHDHKDYLHRSGRTARAGASGTVLALADPDQVRTLGRTHADAGVTASVREVEPGDRTIRQLAASGTPVPPAPEPAPERRPTGRPPRRRQPGRRPATAAGQPRRTGAA